MLSRLSKARFPVSVSALPRVASAVSVRKMSSGGVPREGVHNDAESEYDRKWQRTTHHPSPMQIDTISNAAGAERRERSKLYLTPAHSGGGV